MMESDSPISPAALQIAAVETLSPEVASLITSLLDGVKQVDLVDDVFDDDFIANLPSTNVSSYLEIVASLKPHFHQVDFYMRHIDPEEFLTRYAAYYEWLCVELCQYLAVLTDSCRLDPAITYSSLLRACCVLEKSLRNILVTVDGTCPMMLKDIIKHKTISNILGGSLIKLLDVLVGPPTSLNVRNLVWHGFGSESEDLGRFSCYVIWVTGVIGKVIQQAHSGSVRHSPFHLANTQQILQFHPSLCKPGKESMCLVTPVKAYQTNQALRFAEQGEFGVALMLLLTAVEHSVRVTYCEVNCCPERQMTAVDSEHFTTLDHVFEELQPNGKSNVMYQMIPDRLRTAVHDLLLYPNGLRLRDKLSHMELSYLDVTEALWLYSLNVTSTVLFAIHSGFELCDVYNYLCTEYTPVYHPVSNLLQLLADLREKLASIFIDKPKQLNIPPEKDGQCAFLDILRKRFPVHTGNTAPIFNLFSAEQGTRNLSVTSQFNEVREWYKMCESIVRNLIESVTLLACFSNSRVIMYNNLELRSRQRKNYISFLCQSSCILETVRCLYMAMVYLTNQTTTAPCVVTKSEKSLIQLSENITTFCQQNKWSQCVQFIDEFVSTRFLKPH